MITQPPQQQQLLLLIATSDDGQTRRYHLRPDEGVFVGRSSNCGMKLSDASIADIHCRIDPPADGVWIHDWMSNGGTRINGESIWTKVKVSDGDVIRVGGHTITLASCDDQPEPTRRDRDSEPERRRAAASEGESESAEDSWLDVEFDFDIDDDDQRDDQDLIAVLQTEIEYLRTELSQREAELQAARSVPEDGPATASDQVLDRMQQLIDEANRSDERVSLLEEMLHCAEDANRSEQEERQHLEAWVGDIEQRVSAREEEHTAEINLIRKRLAESQQEQSRLQKRLGAAAGDGSAALQFEETVERLQQANQELQSKLDEACKQNQSLERRIEQINTEQQHALRGERAKLAQEQAKISRLRYELTSKLSAVEELPKPDNQADQESAQRIRALREHLREIHEQEKRDEREAPLTHKLARLWQRIEG